VHQFASVRGGLSAAGVMSLPVLAIAMMMAGCASTGGPSVVAAAAMGGPPKAGTARIIVMRPFKGFFGLGDRAFPVKVDQEPPIDLYTGSFVAFDHPPGRHQVSAELWDLPSGPRLELEAMAGRTYFLMAKLNDDVARVYGMSAAGGLLGKAIAIEAAPTLKTRGAIEVTLMDEASGRQLMASLKPTGG